MIPAGKATPAPPTGPILGQAKVNIGELVTRFNAGTKDMMGEIVRVIIRVYEDKTFDLEFKSSPATTLILKALGKEKGSGKNTISKVGVLPKAKVKEIAEKKLKDLNAKNLEGAIKIIEGSARSMGVDIR